MELNADYLEGFFGLSQTRVKHLYDFKPRPHMAIVKGFATNNLGWKDNFFFVRLDEATASEECLPFFKRSWGRRANGTDRFINPSLLVSNFLFAFQFMTSFLRSRKIYSLFETSCMEVRFSEVTSLRQEFVQRWRFTNRELVLQSRKTPSHP